MIDVLGLADDLTGALETGAKFDVPVTTGLSIPARESAIVIDTETRHVAPREASARVEILAREARERGVRLLYKKTDSTLRGNIGAELGALLRVFAGARIHYAPAYPALGRTVRDGVLHVHGVPVSQTSFARDPLDPIRESHIPSLLAAQCGQPGIVVYDGETEEDVRAVARLLTGLPPPVLAAGPAALAGYLGSAAPAPRWPVLATALVINGSLNEVSVRQMEYAEEHGLPGWTILRSDVSGSAGLDRATRVGDAVRKLLESGGPGAVVVFGGDTAFGILAALGSPLVRPLGEILPGVPVSRVELPGRTLHLITKAGGFGPPDLLVRLRELCQSEE